MGNLLVPALHTVCKMTHKIAIAADLAASTTGSRDYAKLQNAATLLQESFSRTINDRKEFVPRAPYSEEGSKKAGVLLIVNELFAIYFRLNTLRLCKNLLRPVEGRKLHEDGSLGQMVTYRYYTGRLALFEDQYSEAEANLQFAFDHCHYKALRNKQAILRYLVPVKLYRGRLPSPQRKFCRHNTRKGRNGIFGTLIMQSAHHYCFALMIVVELSADFTCHLVRIDGFNCTQFYKSIN